MALGDYLLSNQSIVYGQSVIELGAGTGFLAILCSRLRAKRVTATDGSDKMVELLKANITANNEQDQIAARKLWFGSGSVIEEKPFDVVLGADVTYDESILAPLCLTVSRMLEKNKNVIVLIAATVRRKETQDYPMHHSSDRKADVVIVCKRSRRNVSNTT